MIMTITTESSQVRLLHHCTTVHRKDLVVCTVCMQMIIERTTVPV